VEMAAEIGIGREALDSATVELAQNQAAELASQTEAKELAIERAHQFTKFVSSLLTLAVVGVVVYLADTRLHLGSWVYWILLVWGVLVALRLRHVVFPHESLARRKRREQKHMLREQRRARREAFRNEIRQRLGGGGDGAARAIEQSTREFEHAVQAGVSALLSVAARKIQEHAERNRRGGPRKS
jgi:hypothetical protein